MSNIVEEIIDAGKTKIQTILPDFKELLYATDLETNACGKLDNRFGFLAGGATFKTGGSMGFTTMDHSFEVILTDEMKNQDSDAPLQNKTNKLFEYMNEVIKCFEKQKLILATPTNCILIITGVSLEKPEFLNENSGVALRANFNFQYRFKTC